MNLSLDKQYDTYKTVDQTMFPCCFLACNSRQFYHDLFHQPLNQATMIIITHAVVFSG